MSKTEFKEPLCSRASKWFYDFELSDDNLWLTHSFKLRVLQTLHQIIVQISVFCDEYLLDFVMANSLYWNTRASCAQLVGCSNLDPLQNQLHIAKMTQAQGTFWSMYWKTFSIRESLEFEWNALSHKSRPYLGHQRRKCYIEQCEHQRAWLSSAALGCEWNFEILLSCRIVNNWNRN